MRQRPTLLSLSALLLLFQACEKASLEEVMADGKTMGTEKTSTLGTTPSSVGEGTQAAPFTVGQVLNGEGMTSRTAWYAGYVVGSTYGSMLHPIWDAETTYTSNILLSEDSLCTDTKGCIPVELKSTALQKRLSLHHNPAWFRQCIVVKGTYGLYFRVNGIRDVQDGYCLPGFILPTLSPTEWDETETTF